jgi:hypothetical protein
MVVCFMEPPVVRSMPWCLGLALNEKYVRTDDRFAIEKERSKFSRAGFIRVRVFLPKKRFGLPA